MKLSEKILLLRKRQGLSQEALAEQLHVSRQAVSRWEMGTALPDAANLLQLSDLFGVTADYLLREELEDTPDAPPPQPARANPKRRTRFLGIGMAVMGLAGNLTFYVLSRFIQVLVPFITYDDAGKKWYHWSSDHTGYSYRYFIQEHHLEGLTALLWLLVVLGLVMAFANHQALRARITGAAETIRRKFRRE